jgi:hypothetical protein
MEATKADNTVRHHKDSYSGYEARCPVCNRLNFLDFLVKIDPEKDYPYSESYSEFKDFCKHLYKVQWDGMHGYWFYFVPAV